MTIFEIIGISLIPLFPVIWFLLLLCFDLAIIIHRLVRFLWNVNNLMHVFQIQIFYVHHLTLIVKITLSQKKMRSNARKDQEQRNTQLHVVAKLKVAATSKFGVKTN